MTADLPTPDLTVRETAAELNCTEKNVRNLIDRGDLAAIRYGTRFVRIPRASLDAFKAAHSTLLDEQTRAHLAEKAAAAPDFTEAQEDTIRAAFRRRRERDPSAPSDGGR